MDPRLEDYICFLESLNQYLEQCFEDQKEFIKCQKGCSLCCKEGNFPVSEAEFRYLQTGIENLSPDIKNIINSIYKEFVDFLKQGNEKIDFSYQCPFLEADECIIYKFRPIMCRTQGLISRFVRDGIERINIPFCVHFGLNYSNAWNIENKTFIDNNFSKKPVFFDIGYSDLIKMIKTGHGELKMMVEWLISYSSI